jgi:CheY-like chemotaxis protein
MYKLPGRPRRTGVPAVLAGLLAGAVLAGAQAPLDDFPTGAAASAWSHWQPAMQAILDRSSEKAEQHFADLLATEPSALRIALLADRTVERTALGGAVLLLEQDAESKALGPNGQKMFDLLAAGREQMNQADDGWYFSAIGRFDVAEANFAALLSSQPDPVALLEFTDQVKRRRDVLIGLLDNPVLGDEVRGILRLLDQGEARIKADPVRIKSNIERLGGPPRGFENAVAWLKQSGEYAIPFLVQYLRDPAKEALEYPILRALPQIDRPALNPLVIALRMNDVVTLRYLVEAVGKIGYAQSLPYLLKLRAAAGTPPDILSAVDEAIGQLAARNPDLDADVSPAEAFYRLAEGYYDNRPSLAADPRLDTANVWYWRDELLQNLAVPTQIFDEVMCLRCCEESLLLEPERKPAQALWVAADFRRETQLAEDQTDATRPENYPNAAYFAQTAGTEVCLMTLERGLDDGDPAVALGAIEALRNIAGPASLVSGAAGRLPLAEALSFPDRMVRIRAALTLGTARPVEPFQNYQNLVPVLSEALHLFGGANSALVVAPDETANRIAALLRADGYEVLTDAAFLSGLQKVRRETAALNVIFLSATLPDIALADAVRQIRAEVRFAATPIVLISAPGSQELVTELARGDHRMGIVQPNEPEEQVRALVQRLAQAVGIRPITPEVGTGLALEAAEALRLLGLTRNPLFAVPAAEPALLAALASPSTELRLAAAQALAYVPTEPAQEAIARIALNESEPEELRVKMFAALAQAARQSGNHLGGATVDQLVAVAERDSNLVIRTAASQALGALDLPGGQGSTIIRNQHAG